MTLNNGARYSVLVQLNKTPGNYLITAAGAGINQKVAGYGTFSYIDGDPSVVGKPSIDYGGNSISTDVVVLDENKIKPLIPSQPSEQADQTYLLTIGRIEKAWKWSLNGDHSYSMSLESEKPMLWDPQSQADSDLVIATNNDTWVDIVFVVSGEPSTIQPGHPTHKHSNRVYVLVSYFEHFEYKFHCMDPNLCVFKGVGTGEFNWTSVAEAQQEIPEMFNLVDPPMRGMRYTAFHMVFLVLGTNGWGRYLHNASCFGSAKLDGSSLSWYVFHSLFFFFFSSLFIIFFFWGSRS